MINSIANNLAILPCLMPVRHIKAPKPPSLPMLSMMMIYVHEIAVKTLISSENLDKTWGIYTVRIICHLLAPSV